MRRFLSVLASMKSVSEWMTMAHMSTFDHTQLLEMGEVAGVNPGIPFPAPFLLLW